MRTVINLFLYKVAGSLLPFAFIVALFVQPVSALTDEPAVPGKLVGVIKDAETGELLAYAYIHIDGLNRTATSNREGQFSLSNIPAGSYNLLIHRLSYGNRAVSFEIRSGETTELVIEMQPSILTRSAVEVVARNGGFLGSNVEHASAKISGNELRRNLGTTLSETISHRPGIDQRTMGAAPARPVIRGLGDERLIILQDGERTGDVSATAADHSVTVDPISAAEIQIARGPAALAYGGNAIGGVVNVVKNQIPTSVPGSVSGSATLQRSSVNSGIAGSGLITIPGNNLVYTIDLNGRFGRDYQSPLGAIDNSGYFTTNSAFGASYIRPWGYTGLAVNAFLSEYGIPPDPDGGHPDGVDISMQRFQVESRSEFLLSNSFFKLLEGRLSYRYYNHKEFETDEIIGTEFLVNTTNLSLTAKHHPIGFLRSGRVGLWGEFREYNVFDRANIESLTYSSALFAIQEADFGPLHVELGARFESSVVTPQNAGFSSLLGEIKQRSFLGLASSASLIYDFGGGWYLGTVFMHSFRPPSSEELYSQGPHVAAYSFEIGNPELDPERGLGMELFLRYRTPRVLFELNGYSNNFSNYIYPRDTGRASVPFPSLNEYQFEGIRAHIYGAEIQAEMQLSSGLVANGSFSYTIGNRHLTDEELETLTADISSSEPLPMIPPLSAKLGLTYTINNFSAGARYRFSAEQTRTAMFEEQTEEYHLADLSFSYSFASTGNMLHTFSLNVDNLLNTEYRNHLSRLKEVFPEPGRNVRLLYRLYF